MEGHNTQKQSVQPAPKQTFFAAHIIKPPQDTTRCAAGARGCAAAGAARAAGAAGAAGQASPAEDARTAQRHALPRRSRDCGSAEQRPPLQPPHVDTAAVTAVARGHEDEPLSTRLPEMMAESTSSAKFAFQVQIISIVSSTFIIISLPITAGIFYMKVIMKLKLWNISPFKEGTE